MQPPTQPAAAPGAATPPGPSRVEFILAAVVIALMALMAYSNTFRVPFYFDDRQGITDNQTIEMLRPPWFALDAPMYHCSGAIGRPLVNFSLAVNYQVSEAFSPDQDGREPWSYHVFNLIVHIATAWLLTAVMWRTLRQPALARRFGAAAFPLAFAIALVWAVHPLVSETVTNAIQRNESMVSFFYLLTIYCFIRSANSWRGWAWQTGAVVACYLGVISKEVMFSAPLMVMLYDRTFVAGTFAKALKIRWQFYLFMLTSWSLLGFLVIHYKQRGGTVGFDLPMSKYEYALKQCAAIITYFKLAFWPHPLVLDYGYDVVQKFSTVWPQALLLALLVGGTAWALWRKPVLGFAGAWVFIILAPSSSIMPLTTQTEAEHRMYLPLAAFVTLTILAVYTWAGRRTFIAAGLLTLALAGATFARNRDYRSELIMWEVTTRERPHNERAHYDLGCALLDKARYLEAAAEFKLALEIDPKYVDAHTNLGACYANLGDEPSAMVEYQTGVKLEPTDVQSNYNLGCVYWNRQDLAAAADHLRVAAENDTTYADAQSNYGAVLTLSDHSLEALAPLKAALDLEPHNTSTLAYFGTALQAQGKLANAIAIFQKGLALKPESTDLHKKLAGAWAEADQLARAVAEDTVALRLSPGDAEAHYLYGKHLYQLGQFEDAVTEFTAATHIRDDYPEAENDLGSALKRLKRLTEAKAAYNRALALKPEFAEARSNLGTAYLADNQLPEAEEQFRLALQTDPDYAEAHNNLGSVLIKENRYNEATFQFQEALRIDPDYADAKTNLKNLQSALGGQ